jgi:hypothetical protein
MCQLANASCARMPVDACTRDCEAPTAADDKCGAVLQNLFHCMRERPTFVCNDRGLPEPPQCAGRVLALQDCQTAPPGWARIAHPEAYFSVLLPPEKQALDVGDGIGLAGVEPEISFTVVEIPIERQKAIARTFAEKCRPGARVARGMPSDDGISTTFRLECQDGSRATGYVVQAPEAQTPEALLFHVLVVRGKGIDQRAALFINSLRVHAPVGSPARSRAGAPKAGKATH